MVQRLMHYEPIRRTLGKGGPFQRAAKKLCTLRARGHEGLYDVIEGPDEDDGSIRPNQILVVSLPHSPLAADDQANVVQVCRRHLLTAFGLRSLAPGQPRIPSALWRRRPGTRRWLSPWAGMGLAFGAVHPRCLSRQG